MTPNHLDQFRWDEYVGLKRNLLAHQTAADTAILNKNHARIVAIKKWDERRLAYEINKQKRGIYILAYIQADPANLAGIERDFNLSEQVLRSLVVRADHLTEEEMIAADARQLLQDEGELRRGRPDEMVPEFV